MVEETTIALHTLRRYESYFFDAKKEMLFDANNYSMFKHGSGTVARHYGKALAARFIKRYPSWLSCSDDDVRLFEKREKTTKNRRAKSLSVDLDCAYIEPESKKQQYNNKIYVTCSPYKKAPTAACAVAKYFTDSLNKHLESKGLQKAVLFKIDRLSLFEGDYSEQSEEHRKVIMARNPLALPPGLDLEGSNLIIIDDIRITGIHEKSVLEAVKQHNPRKICKMFVALFEQEKGEENARLEAVINHASISSLENLHHLISGMGDNYIPNARVCKFILRQKDLEELDDFLSEQSLHLLQVLYDYMIGDGYQEMNTYKSQLDVVHKALLRAKKDASNSSQQGLVNHGLRIILGGMFGSSIEKKELGIITE